MEKILVIDDDVEIVDMVEYMLTEDGYTVVGAETGEEGLQVASEFRPDLILCDIMMPGMDGYEILKRTRRDPEMATTPFVFITAKSAPEEHRTGMELGADDYLAKPFTEDELLAAVEAQLEKYDTLQEQYRQQLDLLRHGLSAVLPREMRAPLTQILAHASLLLEGYDAFDEATVRESLRSIKDAGESLNHTLENLLMYSALEGDQSLRLEHPRTADIKEVVLQAAVEVADRHDRRGDLRVQLASGRARMHAFHLRKIVEELIDNAFQFSDAGSAVGVETAFESGNLRLRITDRGPGLSREDVENIGVFIQFDRAGVEQQGGGLGLTVAQRLVDLYNGSLEIDGASDSGTTVTVQLPEIRMEEPAS